MVFSPHKDFRKWSQSLRMVLRRLEEIMANTQQVEVLELPW
jgi:hypothetical protein